MASSWDTDSANPQNWPIQHRKLLTLLMSLFMLVSPISSSVVAPALPILQVQLQISSPVTMQMILSVFILSSAVGPLVLSPLSEVYGRRIILHLTMLFFFIFNLACAFSRTTAQLLIFRFLAGIGGSAPSLGPGILGDCWRKEERGRSLRLYYIFTLLGPALGPVVGGFIVTYSDWRWLFYSTSILSAAIQLPGLFLLPETYPSLVLAKLSRDPEFHTHSPFVSQVNPDPWKVLSSSLVRPLKLLATQLIIQVLALFLSFLYGLLYLALSTYVTVFTDIYEERSSIATLNYISLAIGFTLGTQVTATICDKLYLYLVSRHNNAGVPEYRAPILAPGGILVPIGLFIYGWSVQCNTHWIVPNIGAAILGCGIIIGMQAVTSYIVDTYPMYAASATAALTVPRAISGFTFPLFAPSLYRALGYGWGNSILGFLAMAIGWPAPFILWRYGATLRRKSPYATDRVIAEDERTS